MIKWRRHLVALHVTLHLGWNRSIQERFYQWKIRESNIKHSHLLYVTVRLQVVWRGDHEWRGPPPPLLSVHQRDL